MQYPGAFTAAQGRKNRRELLRQLKESEKQKFLSRIAALRAAEARAKADRKARLLEATQQCDEEAAKAKAEADAAWKKARELARDARRAKKAAEKRRCALSKSHVRQEARSKLQAVRHRKEQAKAHRQQIARIARGEVPFILPGQGDLFERAAVAARAKGRALFAVGEAEGALFARGAGPISSTRKRRNGQHVRPGVAPVLFAAGEAEGALFARGARED